MFEYLGAGKDHSAAWLKFKKDLKSVIVQQKLDNLLEQIIDDGVDPEVEELNLHKLMKNVPSKVVSVKQLH